MSRACCCSVSHADAISPITTIQYGDAMIYAKRFNHPEIVLALEQVSECVWGGGGLVILSDCGSVRVVYV